MNIVVIPCKNEEATIGALVRGCFDNGANIVCVNDDSSTDKTASEAWGAGAKVRRIQHCRRGLADVYRYPSVGHNALVEIDAGGSHDPRDLPQFWEALARGSDLVTGHRAFTRGDGGISPREGLSLCGTLLTNAIHHTEWLDATSGFCGYSPHAQRTILSLPTWATGHFYQTEIRLRAHALGLSHVEVPISYKPSSSSLRLRSVIEALYLVFALKGKL